MIFSAAALIVAAPAFAQGLIAPTQQYAHTPPYETPLYKSRPSTLDKNYGLPTFGMPGAELPKQRTMAPVARRTDNPSADGRRSDGQLAPGPQPQDDSPEAASGSVPDFFPTARKFVLPSELATGSGETPMFTTTDGTAADAGTRSVFAMPSEPGTVEAPTPETPLFTTGADAATR
jgi:hypothetical protein